MPRFSRIAICIGLAVVGVCALGAGRATAADKSLPTFTDAAQAGPDATVQGEYVGEVMIGGKKFKCGLQVIALGEGKFHVVAYQGGLPGDGWEPGQVDRDEADGEMKDGTFAFHGNDVEGKLKDGMITVSSKDGQTHGELKRVERKSPTLGAKPPEGAKVLFDGTTPAHFAGGKMTEDKLLLAGPTTKQGFNDFTLHLEFRTPFMPTARRTGPRQQRRLLAGSLRAAGARFLRPGGKGQRVRRLLFRQGAEAEHVPAAAFVADLRRGLHGGPLRRAARRSRTRVVTIRHNGVPIFENFEMPDVTPGGEGKETPAPGPLALQFHGNPVHYRNIWIVEKK